MPAFVLSTPRHPFSACGWAREPGNPYLVYPAIHQGEGAEVFFVGHAGLLCEGIGDEIRRGLLRAVVGRVSGRSDKARGCAGCCCERCNLVRDEARSSSVLADPASRHYGKCADVREVFAGGLLSGCGAGLLWLRLEISLLAVQGGEEGRSRQPWLPGSNAVAGGGAQESKWDKSANLDGLRRCQRTKRNRRGPGAKQGARSAKNP